jgi:hypothetical protein
LLVLALSARLLLFAAAVFEVRARLLQEQQKRKRKRKQQVGKACQGERVLGAGCRP